jgi:hypothetical protein
MASKKSAKKVAKKSAKSPMTYLVTYHMNAAATKRALKMQVANPEGSAEGMNAWMTWAAKCGDKLIDLGAPLANSVKLDASGAVPSKRAVAGYSLLKAASMAEAKKLMNNHPHLAWGSGCEIEIHEARPMPGM